MHTLRHYFSTVLALTVFIPGVALGITCGFGSDIGGGQCRGYLTTGSSWTVPSDWNSANNVIDAIGGGGGMGGGGMGGLSAGGVGGGGGAFARKANLTLTPGSSISYSVGLGAGGSVGSVSGAGPRGDAAPLSLGTGTANGGDTWFQSRGALLAKGASASSGGLASASVGDLKYSGGNGTEGSSWSMDPNFFFSTGGSGGGAASMYGSPNTCGGPEGGGSGALGGCRSTRPTGKEYDATHGSGKGGGGGGAQSDGLCMMAEGAGGGFYGGGGGGAASDPDCPTYVSSGGGASGAQGLIVITYTPNTNPLISCSVTFDSNPLTGNSTTMRWSSVGADTFYINGVGYVSASGSSQVYTPGDYSGSVSGPNGTARCAAVLASTGSSSCVPTADHDGTPSLTCRSDGNLYDSCGNKTACQWGCSASTNACYTTCQSRSICNTDNTKVIHSCSGVTIDDCAAKNYMCSAGACVPPSITFLSFDTTDPAPRFTASGHLQARPTLLRSGDSSRLFWNATHATSCAVSGTNGDHWNTVFSGSAGVVTSSITGRTTYTMTCSALPGATPSIVRESVHINVVPNFQER